MAFKPLSRPSPTSGLPQNEFLQNIGKKYDKTAAQVALNWLIARNKSVIAIPKAVNPHHLEENARAMGWRLKQEDIESISSQFGDYLLEYGITGQNLP
jgi:diketogulonate reductase-like aldo/keto reductase